MGTAERLRCNRRGGMHREGRFAGAPSSDRNICVRWRWETQHGRGCDGRRPAGDGGRQSVAADGDLWLMAACGVWRRVATTCGGSGRAAGLRLMAPNWISIAPFRRWGAWVMYEKKKRSGTWLKDGRVGNFCQL
jgi:hypothetical protein